jgi:hypothetical protein
VEDMSLDELLDLLLHHWATIDEFVVIEVPE